jgi:chromosome segregation ATPase
MAEQRTLITCRAFLELDRLQAEGELPLRQASALKQVYADASALFAATLESEREALSRYSMQALRLDEETTSLGFAKARLADAANAAALAAGERDALAAQLAAAAARDGRVVAELAELASQRMLVGEALESACALNAVEVEPVLAALGAEAAEAAAEAAAARVAAAAAEVGAEKARFRGDNLKRATAKQAATVDTLRVERERVEKEPPKVAQAAAVVGRLLEGATAELARVGGELEALRGAAGESAAAVREAGGVRTALDAALAQHGGELAAREREVAALEAVLRRERAAGKELLEKKVVAGAAAERGRSAAAAARAAAERAAAAYEAGKRALAKRVGALNAARARRAPLAALIEQRSGALEGGRRRAAEAAAAEAGVKRQMDVLVAQYLREEAAEKRGRDAVAEAAAACAALEEEGTQWAREEAAARKQLAALKAQRDLKRSELARLAGATEDAEEARAGKQRSLEELSEAVARCAGKGIQFFTLAEAANKERAAAAQEEAEVRKALGALRERERVLGEERLVLTQELTVKERALERDAHAMTGAALARDGLRADACKLAALNGEADTAIEGASAQVGRLMAALRATAGEAARLRALHSSLTESRNAAANAVAAAQREWALFGEKAAAQSGAGARGEAALRGVEEEVRTLRLARDDLLRRINAATAAAPGAAAELERLRDLEAEVARTEAEVEKLSALLVAPDGGGRLVRLPGADGEAEDLEATALEMEGALGKVREAVLQRGATLEELRAARDAAVAAAAGTGAGDSALDLARAINEATAKLRDMGKRLMASVAELALHQATEMQLAAEAARAESAKADAEERLAKGLPPTAAAEARLAAALRIAGGGGGGGGAAE